MPTQNFCMSSCYFPDLLSPWSDAILPLATSQAAIIIICLKPLKLLIFSMLFQNVECFPIDRPPYYRCGPCPSGLTGNGTSCSDVDECDLADPCDEAVTCYNTIGGFRCGPCPKGYDGSDGFEGTGLDFAMRCHLTEFVACCGTFYSLSFL